MEALVWTQASSPPLPRCVWIRVSWPEPELYTCSFQGCPPVGSTDSLSPVQGSFPAPTWNWRLSREGYPQTRTSFQFLPAATYFPSVHARVAQPQRWDTGEVMGSQSGWSLQQQGPNKWSRQRNGSLSCSVLPGAGVWHHGGAKREKGDLEGGQDVYWVSLRPGAYLSLSFSFCA